MKVVILAGGLGTRISEESHLRPKPMIEIGGKPIIWHIMKIYDRFGFRDFIIPLGYKGEVIKDYFANYAMHSSSITFDLETGEKKIHSSTHEPWRITLVDTGLYSGTGGRLKLISEYLEGKPFMMTYGDGVSDVNIRELLLNHKNNSGIATMTASRPTGRYGTLEFENDQIKEFREKHQEDEGWINAGFFVMEPEALQYIDDASTGLEHGPLQKIAKDGKLYSYRHRGFWAAMDTMRDKQYLEELWAQGNAPWKTWND